jgi:superfamily I DNA and/or RNA helicase
MELSQLKDEIFSWQSQGKDMAIALNILAKYTKKYKSSFDRSLIDAIDKIRAFSTITKNTNALDMLDQEDNEYLKKLVYKQRITTATFSDDGINNIKILKNDIINGTYESKLPNVLPDFIDEVIKSDGENEAAFNEYVAFVNELKENLFEENNINTTIAPANIDECLNKLIYELDNILSSQIGNQKEASAKILLDYKIAINTGEAERIVNEYSRIRAATCQQSMQLNSSDNFEYDLVVVDEAARANPLDLFIPMSMAKKIVLVGDQRQLPHMLDPDVERKLESLNLLDKLDVYKKSFFELLFDKLYQQEHDYPYSRTCSLTKQYRMIPEISDFVADNIYRPTNVELECGLDDITISNRKIKLESYKNKSLVWVNVSKEKGLESNGKSKFRPVEAKILIENLKSILGSTNNIKSVGIITFYSKQKEELIKLVNEQFTPAEKSIVEIGTVDAFQGKEYDIVFLSCVRSNSISTDQMRKAVGFLCDENRLCVALSRARNLLVAVGDSATVSNVKILNNFIETCKDGRGCYINA